MKKLTLILGIILMILICSCVHPVLNKNEYIVIDTLKADYNNFGKTTGAYVIIKYGDTYHYGRINEFGDLMEIQPRNIKIDRLK